MHVDLMEHPDTVSAAGNKYVMDVINNFLSYAWAIPLASKGDAPAALQAWERARKLETGSKVGIFRSDNGELKRPCGSGSFRVVRSISSLPLTLPHRMVALSIFIAL
jgi:hypothetical protein